MHLSIRTTGLPSFLRLVATKAGSELPSVPNGQAPPGSYEQDIVIPTEWGTGDDYALCVTSAIPAWSECVPFVITSPSCAAPMISCAGVCIDPRNDVLNCGSCRHECSAPTGATPTCQLNVCRSICPSGLELCGDRCVNTLSDSLACGSCGHACVSGASCTGGSCVSTCTLAGYALCGGLCVSTTTDSANCGGCGHQCALPNAVAICSGSTCSVTSCTPGWFDCDGIPSNGCESSAICPVLVELTWTPSVGSPWTAGGNGLWFAGSACTGSWCSWTSVGGDLDPTAGLRVRWSVSHGARIKTTVLLHDSTHVAADRFSGAVSTPCFPGTPTPTDQSAMTGTVELRNVATGAIVPLSFEWNSIGCPYANVVATVP